MQIKQDHIVIVVLTLLLAGFIALVAASTGSHGGEDSFMHYLFARYVPQHPENLLSHWGKPLFTLFLTPFAQYGYTVAKVYNCIAGILAAWFTYKTAERLGLKTSVAAVVLLLFAPLFFLCINSALTEVTFALFLIAGIYFIVCDKYYAAAIILSFLPFARTEGFIILPVIAAYFLWQRKYIHILFLGSGLALYSIIGYFHYHDLFWVFTKNPYADQNGVYGKSSYFWHFADGYRDIIGDPQKWLFAIGFISFLISLNKTLKTGWANASETVKHWVLIISCSLAYFFAHSTVWYFGIQGSAGLIRVMAGILPLLALVSNRGLEAIYKRIPINANIRLAVMVTILFFVVEYPIKRYHPPIELGTEEQLIYTAGDWYKTTPYHNGEQKVYYFAPTVGIAFDIDPFDFSKRDYLNNAKQSEGVAKGSIVVYDTHFGPQECKYPFEDISNDPNYVLLQKFQQSPERRRQGDMYEIYIYKRK